MCLTWLPILHSNRFLDGFEIRPSPKYRFDEDGDTIRLTIKDVKDSDKGDITCELINNKGRESANCKLSVQGMKTN